MHWLGNKARSGDLVLKGVGLFSPWMHKLLSGLHYLLLAIIQLLGWWEQTPNIHLNYVQMPLRAKVLGFGCIFGSTS